LRLRHLNGFLRSSIRRPMKTGLFRPKCSFPARSSGLPIFFGQTPDFLTKSYTPSARFPLISCA
jgi:hypothetical protein